MKNKKLENNLKLEYFCNDEWLTKEQLMEHFKTLFPDFNKREKINKQMMNKIIKTIQKAPARLISKGK